MTPAPAPALTDEQIDKLGNLYREAAIRFVDRPEVDTAVAANFDRWLAAVIARAKREEREAAADHLRNTIEIAHGIGDGFRDGIKYCIHVISIRDWEITDDH